MTDTSKETMDWVERHLPMGFTAYTKPNDDRIWIKYENKRTRIAFNPKRLDIPDDIWKERILNGIVGELYNARK